MEGVVKSFPFEGQTERCTPASRCDLGLQQTLEWLDSGPLNPAQCDCMLLCRPGKNPAARQQERLHSAGVCWRITHVRSNEAHMHKGRHTRWHMQACVHIRRLSHAHIINSLLPRAVHLHSTTLSREWEQSAKFHQAALLMCSLRSILHFHKSHFIPEPPPPPTQSMALASTQLDKWSMVNCQVEEWKAHHHSTPQSAPGSEGNTSYNVTSKTKQQLFAAVLFVSKHSSATCWKVDFLRDGGNSQGQPAVGDAGFLYIAVKLWVFFPMFTSSNNNLASPWEGRVPEENYPPISKLLLRVVVVVVVGRRGTLTHIHTCGHSSVSSSPTLHALEKWTYIQTNGNS